MLIGIDASRAARPERTGTENYAYHMIRCLLALYSAHRFRLYYAQPPPAGLFDSRAGTRPAPVNLPESASSAAQSGRTAPPRRGAGGNEPRAETRVLLPPRLWTHLGLGAEMLRHPPDVLFVPAHVLPLVHPRASVVTIHDLGHHYFPAAHTFAQRAYLEWSTRFAVRHAARIIAVSQSTKDDLIRLYGADPQKLTVVHHGVQRAPDAPPGSTRALSPALAARWQLPPRYVLAIGTVQPRKNYARLIAAFASLALPREDAALVIVGKLGWNSAQIEAQAERAHVVLTGHVPDADKLALLDGARAFALPSLYEGFGMPILEAQAAGIPVITSSTSSCPEVAGDGALLVNPLDTSAIAAALRRVLFDEPLRAGLSAKGRANAANFTWERCAWETLDVLEAAHA